MFFKVLLSSFFANQIFVKIHCGIILTFYFNSGCNFIGANRRNKGYSGLGENVYGSARGKGISGTPGKTEISC